MRPPATSNVARHPRYTPKLIAPFAILSVAAFLLCAGFAFVLANQGDRRHQDEQRASFLRSINDVRTIFIERTIEEARKVGDELSRSSTSASALSKIIPSDNLPLRYSKAYLFIFKRDRTEIETFPVGETPVPPGIQHLVERLRDNIKSGAGQVGVSDLHREPVVSEYIAYQDHPALAVATFARPSSENAKLTDRAVLATVISLDERFMGALDRTSSVAQIGIGNTAPLSGREVQSIIDGQGRIIGWLSWKAEQPMMNTLFQILPLLAIAFVFLIVFAATTIRQVSRTSRSLVASEAHAQQIAHEDPLTGLANRRKLFNDLDHALATRQEDEIVTFAFFDLDGFKDVNENLGYASGDELLCAVARRIQITAPENATVGRLAGDNFALILTDYTPETAVKATKAIVEAIGQPFQIANQTVQIGASAGLVHAPRDGQSREDILRRSDLAVRAAKRSGNGQITGFSEQLEESYRNHLFIKHELRRALDEMGLAVYYQPIVAADGDQIVGVEALLRWWHPVRGEIPPALFIPIAEQTGLMGRLGEFVLRRAINDAVQWPGLYVAVNLSPLQVRDRGLTNLIAKVLDETGLPAERLMLEITEGVLIENPEEAQQRLRDLRALGAKIALDDFGSGYSSLSYLRTFPIDKLKIDKEFVAPLGRLANGGVIVQAIMALGRALGLAVLCEGVETEEQRILLRLAGCDEMQGYLFARPSPRSIIDKMVATAGAKGRFVTLGDLETAEYRAKNTLEPSTNISLHPNL